VKQVPEDRSVLWDAVRLGKALEGELVLDAHTHLGPWFNFWIPDHDIDSMFRVLDRLGVDAIACSADRAIGPDYIAGNDEVAAAQAKYPRRVIMYVTINPRYPKEEVEAELRRWEAAGKRAYKIHCATHQTPEDDEAYQPMWDLADRQGAPVLVHTHGGHGKTGIELLTEIAQARTNLKIIIAHSANSLEVIEQACAAARKRENIYLDLTGSPMVYGALEMMVDRVGAQRVLFGTDTPFIDPRPQLGRVAYSRLTDDEKRSILGLNAKELFGEAAAHL
jgi:predicted TIM-barrel fold metal-dependent hydrolase